MRFPKLPAPTLALLVLAYFLPALLEGRLLAPGDGIAQNMPVRVMIGEALWHGHLPFWNPYAFGGMPLLATLHPGAFFPGNAAYLFFGPTAATNLTVLLAFWVAVWATYAFARALGLAKAPAVLAALVYALGGFMACRVGPVQMAQVAGLVPAGLWAVERLAATGLRRYALAFWAVLTLQILAGHPQVQVFGALMIGPYALMRAWAAAGGAPRFLARLALGALLAVGAGSLQLLPALAFIAESQRQTADLARLVEGSVPPRLLPALLFPLMYGSATSPLFDVPYWGPGLSMFGYFGYVGLLPLLLAGCALLGARRRQVVFWALVAALALLLTLGDATPLYRLWAHVPVLDKLAGPNRHFMEFDLAVGLLAAFGLQGLHEAGARRRVALAGGVLLLALVGVLAAVALGGQAYAHKAQALMPADVHLAYALSPARPAFWLPPLLGLAALGLSAWYAVRPRRPAAVALLTLAFGDLLLFGHHVGWRQFSPHGPLALPATPAHAEGRVLGVADVAYPYFRGLGPLVALHMPGMAAMRHERSVGGYDAFIPGRYGRLMGMSSVGDVTPATPVWRPGHHALDLLGLRWLWLSPGLAATPAWQAILSEPRWRPLRDGGFENTHALPRAWCVSSVASLDAAQVDARLTADPAFDPASQALLDAPAAVSGPCHAGPVVVQDEGPNGLDLAGAGPGFVVVSEGYDAGWRASSKAGPIALQRVDALVMGFAVPAGPFQVQLRYEPPRWRPGLAASALSLLLVLAWASWPRRRVPAAVAESQPEQQQRQGAAG